MKPTKLLKCFCNVKILCLAKNYETSYGSKNHTLRKSVVLSVDANSLLYNFCKLQ